MGRAMTMLVGAAIVGTSFLILSSKHTTLKTHEHQSDYQFKEIASEVARSGFQRGVSAIKRDLMAAPQTFERVTIGDGYYDLQIAPAIYGDLDVAVNAHSGDAAFDVGGNVLFTAPLPAAVMLEDDGVVVSGSGFYQISGVDRRMPSRGTGGGFLNPVRGIMTTQSHVNAVASGLMTSRVVGIGAEPDTPVNAGSVVGGFSEADMEALYQEAILEAHSVLSPNPNGDIPPGQLVSAVSGSGPGNPKIIRARGNLTVVGSLQGHGLLIVEDGDLNVASPDFDWEGLIMVRKQDKDTVDISLLNTTLHGALVAYDADGPPAVGECVPDFEIVGDELVVADSFKVKIEVIGAAITAGGEYDMPVTARINIAGQGFEPWGDYDLALDANVNTGNSGVTYSWEPTTIFEPGKTVNIDGRSWDKKEGEDGDQNDEWEKAMEEHSSSSDGPQVYLLEDGSSVPSVGGFMGQYSVEEFLGEYIENDALVLDENQVIYLFELGTEDTESEAFDLQDLVVVVTLIDASGQACSTAGAPSMLDVAFRDGTQIHYSSEAIAKLGLHLNTIRSTTGVQVARTAMHGGGQNETVVFQEGLPADDGEDADGYSGGGTVAVCHNGIDKTIPQPALGAHIAHGDYLGACSGSP